MHLAAGWRCIPSKYANHIGEEDEIQYSKYWMLSIGCHF